MAIPASSAVFCIVPDIFCAPDVLPAFSADWASLLFTGETSFTAENNEERLTGISAPDYFYYGTNFVINVLL